MCVVKVVETPGELDSVFTIRRVVFIEEQNVPEDEEIDEHDADAVHFLLLSGGEAVAAGRNRYFDDWAQLERIAVLDGHRGRGHGARLTRYMMEHARGEGHGTLVVNSQLWVMGFYGKLGFVEEGEVFLDAGIEHKRMVLRE